MKDQTKRSQARLTKILGKLRPFLLVALLAPVLIAVYQQWVGVRSTLLDANWTQIILGVIILMVAQPLMGWISWCVLNSLGQQFPFVPISAAYFISQAAKYLPGGIWAFPGRVVAYQRLGVEKSASFVSLIQEISVLFFGSAGIGLLGLWMGLPMDTWLQITAITGIMICLAAIVIFQLPLTWKLMQRLRLVSNETIDNFTRQKAAQDWRWLLLAGMGSLLFWLITGWGFYFLINGFSATNSLNILQSASLFGLAWSVGFVVVIAPSGLGVRETALTGLLTPILGPGAAISVAVVARLWWMLGEFGYVVISLVWSARFTRVSSTKENDQADLNA